jgi:hypothetical protein
MTKEESGKEKRVKEKIVAAIRRAAEELGRAPSRGELRRITGVSHYRVLAVFPTLREAVREAGLEPNPKGEKISTEDLLSDWKRVAEKLGRRPSRAEYVREGKYSAGALTVRFGSWGNISTTEDTEKHRGSKPVHRGGAETRRRSKPGNHPFDRLRAGSGHEETQREKRSGHLVIGTSGDRKAGAPGVFSGAELHRHKRNERRQNNGESVLHNFQRVPLAAVPTPLVGMRRVTESVAQVVVNTLLAPGNWHLALSQNQMQNAFTTHSTGSGQATVTEEHGGRTSGDPVIGTSGDRLKIEASQRHAAGLAPGSGNNFSPLRPSASSVVKKDRPVMGEPFDRSPMTNAPVNELGVMVLFGMVAAGLGLQVESVQGKFPDCIARRQVAPGKWQYLRIEFEYESKNFKLHGHDPKGCDMIVCWRHNWKECPAEIEVVELCRLFGME